MCAVFSLVHVLSDQIMGWDLWPPGPHFAAITHTDSQGENSTSHAVVSGNSCLLIWQHVCSSHVHLIESSKGSSLHSCSSLRCCLCGSVPDWCTASAAGSPEGSLWCSVLCWSKGDTGSWGAAFCWVCVSLGTGRGLRNGRPGSSDHPRYCWETHRARCSCRNCCSRPVGEKTKSLAKEPWRNMQ